MFQPLIILVLSFSFLFHDFHVTHTTLHYDDRKESIDITVKVAVDDLEKALEDCGAKNLRISTENQGEGVDELIKGYFKRRLAIFPNNQSIEYNWVGKELSINLHDLYIYFEIINCNQNGMITSLLVENSIFTEILPDQTNIVLVEFGEKTHNLIFSNSYTRKNLDFKDD